MTLIEKLQIYGLDTVKKVYSECPGEEFRSNFGWEIIFVGEQSFFWEKTKFETKVLKIRKLLIIANFNDGAKNLATLKIWQPRVTAAAAASLVTSNNSSDSNIKMKQQGV